MRVRIESSFIAKVAAAAALVALGDWLFWDIDGVGSTLGVFAIAWTVATVLLTLGAWRRLGAMVAGAVALLIGAILFDDPGLLAVLLFGWALATVVLLPRVRFDHVGRWALRILVFCFAGLIGPWADLIRIGRLARTANQGAKLRGWLPLLPLPLIGGAVFLTLFASANPLIGDTLARIGLPSFDITTFFRVLFWGLLFTFVWATLRPRRIQPTFAEAQSEVGLDLPGISTGSVTLALITFNALFALENLLDLAFLWTGAPLPKGVSLASYAHQGAYPLIATALLAGLFVLVALRPGSDTARVPLIRRLVIAWVAQNVFLVASSILRTVDYIQVYQLTELRIAALIWMALVAVGLVLIVWRMLAAKSGAWLINANALAAGFVLLICSAVDLGSVAATWNVRHAKEAGGQGQALDLCYLNQLNSSALVALVEMEQRPNLPPDFAQRLAWVRHHTLQQTRIRLATGWTWRNQRRMEQLAAMLGGRKLPAPPDPGQYGRNCDGSLVTGPAPDREATDAANEAAANASAPAPLTNAASR
ncbi:DUF4173 domain-containing protein [Sphingomonas sp.]|jgi:hypothetical protein|uniref:DUF4153 domain-containing protein n=1 Tax=Sphingomonas sp. TaxID=28214 RepID=UPI002E356453|nr:DUF4173 domain-containing protein [Sphingomonas sp.]HEX4693091.1 DUF4173 domain-containing protein [Sphingomonas sp.]